MKKRRDEGHEETDKLLEDLEKKIAKEYKQAAEEAQAKLDDYLRRFEIKDEKWQIMVASGKKTAEEYKKWRTGQIMIGQRWEDLRGQLAEDYHNANVIARSYIDGKMTDVYALNHNYATFQIEKDGLVDTAYTLYNRETVEMILTENPDLLPPPGKEMKASIAAGKDIAWQEGKLQSTMLQSILQGESITNISKRIANTLGETNHASTIRYARTAATAAENAGREDAYKRAESLGVKMQREWLATLDNRTRHEHRILDGKKRAIDEPFEVEGEKIMYPGDPSAPGYLIWNCRCRTVAAVDGWEDMSGQLRSNKAIGDMTYDQWLNAKPQYEKITRPEERERSAKEGYINELYRDSKKGVYSSEDDSIIDTRNLADRSMANGLRKPVDRIITDSEIEVLEEERKSIKIPDGVIVYNRGVQTGFRDSDGKIYVRGDVFPDEYGLSARDRMSSKAVLAHEYYGHLLNNPSEYDIGDWRDEYRASRNAALNAPNLSDEERRDLMVDAYDRAKEAGVTLEHDEEARRIIYGE